MFLISIENIFYMEEVNVTSLFKIFIWVGEVLYQKKPFQNYMSPPAPDQPGPETIFCLGICDRCGEDCKRKHWSQSGRQVDGQQQQHSLVDR